MASKKRPAGTNAGNNDRPAQKRQAQAPAPVTGQDAGGEPLPPLPGAGAAGPLQGPEAATAPVPGAGAPAQAGGSDAPGDAQGTAAKAAPEKKHAAAKNGTAQQATAAKTVQEATAPAEDAPGARVLADGEAPVEAAAARSADDDDDLGTDTPARKAAEARKDAARKMDRQAGKKTAASKQAVTAGKAPADDKAPAGKKTAADKKKDAAKAAKADGGKKATDGKKGSGKDAAKAKTAKKRAKLAAPGSAAPEPEDLPCAALLEHLLPGSPELEATCRHGRHVAHLAEQLFEQLAPLHGLEGRWGYRLRLACCLHDIGFVSGRKEHHKKGMRMVEQDTSLPLLPEDRDLVAQLVRYHRKAWPAARHRRFSALGKKDREALCRAAALIRMADALDYRHMEAVQDVSVELRPGKVVLTLSGAGDCTPEQDRLLVKGDLFMHIFGVELECVCPML